MKRLWYLLLALVVVLAGCSQTASDGSSANSTGKKVVRIGWQDSGFPSPFTFGTEGPGGFLRNSF